MSLHSKIAVFRYRERRGLPYLSAQWSGLLIVAALLALTACGAAAPTDTPDAPPAAATLSPTPPPAEATALSSPPAQETQQPSPAASTCVSPAALTPAMAEGPYFKPGSPERQSLLEDNITGTRLILTGYVLTEDCRPVPGALLDFWQADGNGVYDNTGYRLRGHQFTDEAGHYRLETVAPGQYPGRTPHIHVKVQAPGGPILTSQLYFPGQPGNDTDSIFSPQLLVTVQSSDGGVEATFDFVVSGQ